MGWGASGPISGAPPRVGLRAQALAGWSRAQVPQGTARVHLGCTKGTSRAHPEHTQGAPRIHTGHSQSRPRVHPEHTQGASRATQSTPRYTHNAPRVNLRAQVLAGWSRAQDHQGTPRAHRGCIQRAPKVHPRCIQSTPRADPKHSQGTNQWHNGVANLHFLLAKRALLWCKIRNPFHNGAELYLHASCC